MRAGSWIAVGASVQGASHRERRTPCQDAHLWRAYELDGRAGRGEGLILAIADGAGSAPCSATGAQQAVLAATEALLAGLDGGMPADEPGWAAVMRAAYAAAEVALRQVAGAARRPVQDYATTLTCAVLADEWLATGQLGDGWLVAETEAGELCAAARPQRGEYANEAYFLTMNGALDYVEVRAWPQRVRALAGSTDGLLRLALRLPAYEPHPPFFNPLFGFAAQACGGEAQSELLRFLDSPAVCARTDDDKTLVLAARRARPRVGPSTPLLLLAAPAAEDGAL